LACTAVTILPISNSLLLLLVLLLEVGHIISSNLFQHKSSY